MRKGRYGESARSRTRETVGGREAYEAEEEDGAGRDGVCKHARTEDVDVPCAHEQIPHEVATSQTLEEAQGAVVAPDLASPVHVVAIRVVVHDPQSGRVDEQALCHGDDVHIPVEARTVVEGAVGLGEEAAGQGGRDHGVDGLVEDYGKEDLVDVQGQRG